MVNQSLLMLPAILKKDNSVPKLSQIVPKRQDLLGQL
jgi:hypothetical protein